jgi:hypothetical protein
MLTEEEICDLKGTDSDGTPIHPFVLKPHRPTLEKADPEMWSGLTRARLEQASPGMEAPVPDAFAKQGLRLQKQINRGLLVDTAKADTPDAARLFRVRVPI